VGNHDGLCRFGEERKKQYSFNKPKLYLNSCFTRFDTVWKLRQINTMRLSRRHAQTATINQNLAGNERLTQQTLRHLPIGLP
jgi:hypothetical protein